MKLLVSVTDTTPSAITTAITTNTIETAIKQFQLVDKNGNILMNLDGSSNDLSIYGRLMTRGGIFTPAPVTLSGSSTTSTSTTKSWTLLLPFSISADRFPLKASINWNTLASRVASGDALASSSASITVYGTYEAHSFVQQVLKAITIPDSATGTLQMQQYLDIGKTIFVQAFQYGADTNIAATGNGITFTRDGNVEIQSAPLSQFISSENIAYPNSVPSAYQDSNGDNGHIAGVVQLFNAPYVAAVNSQLSIDFTTAPSLLNGTSNQLRAYFIESLN